MRFAITLILALPISSALARCGSRALEPQPLFDMPQLMSVTLVNPFQVLPGREAEFQALWDETAALFAGAPGHLSTRLLRPLPLQPPGLSAPFTHLNIAEWVDAGAYQSALAQAEIRRLAGRYREVCTFQPALYEASRADSKTSQAALRPTAVEIGSIRDDELPALTDLYNEILATTTAVYEDGPHPAAERRDYVLARRAAGFPTLAARDADGRLIGFGSYAAFKAREGYRFTVEHSLQVRADQQGRGVGSAVLARLIREAETAGFHRMVAVIDTEMTASLRLHARHGFRAAGVLEGVGFKFGRWLDIAHMILDLDAR